MFLTGAIKAPGFIWFMTFDQFQNPRARIVCLTHDTPTQEPLDVLFAEANYEVVSPTNAEHADIGVVDLRNRNITPRQASAISSSLRRGSPECTLLFLIDPALFPLSLIHI